MRTEQEIRDRLDRVWLDIGGYMLGLDRCETGVQVARDGQGLAAAGVIVEILEWVLGDDRQSTNEAPPARPGRAEPGANRVPPGSTHHTASIEPEP